MKKFIWLFIVYLILQIGYLNAQNYESIDSLKKELQESNVDSTKVNILLKLSEIYFDINTDSSLLYVNEIFNLYSSNLNKYQIAKSHLLLGKYKNTKSEYDSAYKDYQVALKIFKELNDEHNIATIFSDIGNIKRRQGKYDIALENYMKSLEISERIGFKKQQALTLNNTGLVYYKLNNPDIAMDYHKESLKIAYQIEDKIAISKAYSNIGLVYLYKDKIDSAIHYLKSYLEIIKEFGNKSQYAIAIMNFGVVNFKLEKFDIALDYALKGYHIFEELDEKHHMASCTHFIAYLYEIKQDFELAIEYNQKTIALSNEINSFENLNNGYFSISRIYESQEDYKNALHYFKLFEQYDDSLVNENTTQQLIEAEEKYQNEKKQQQIEVQELKLQTNRLFLTILSIGAFLLIIVIVFIILYSRSRQKSKEQKLNNQLTRVTQQALAAQMNPHFIFNSLNSIQNYILKSDKISSNTYLSKFASLMRMTLNNSQFSFITIEEEINALTTYIELEALRFKDKINYEINIDPNINVSSWKIPPLLLQPYVENAIWHGLMHKEESGILRINLSHIEDKIECIIEDNGIGRKKAAEIKAKKTKTYRSFGTDITKKRLELINNMTSMQLEVKYIDLFENSTPIGTKLILEFPIID